MKEKVLLALSDKNLINILSEQLSKELYIVENVLDGNEVIGHIKLFKPDLLLIDTTLPNKSGYEVLNEKSFDRDVTKIPVMIVSNSGEAFHMNKIPSTPVIKDYIFKSHVEPSEVLEKIDKIFGRMKSNQENEGLYKSTNKSKKILWVEDDKLLSKILTKKIEDSGLILMKAGNSEEAFNFLKKDTPNIIVLDILLPGLDGIEILRSIRSNSYLNSIPVIMLSNLNSKKDIEEANKIGANKFLVKATLTLDEIINEINSLIK